MKDLLRRAIKILKKALPLVAGPIYEPWGREPKKEKR